MIRLLSALFLGLALTLAAAPSDAKEAHGVTLADSASVGGKSLTLNGTGLRSVLFIKVYVLGFYTEKGVTSESAALASGSWKVRLHFLRGLEPQKITDGIQDGFERNSAASIGALQGRLDTFKTFFTKAAKGDVVDLDWNGSGTAVTVNGASKGTVDGKDFADALLRVWVGGDPVQQDMKDGMLAQ